MQVQPYLFFDGRCEEAVEFYKKALGAQVEMLMRWKDSPEPSQPGMCAPGSEDKVMHASFKIGDTSVIASDGQCQGKAELPGLFRCRSPRLTRPRPTRCSLLWGNTVDFTLEPKGEYTNVTWAMHGPAPFISKVMQVFIDMDDMVGKGFEAGLVNLKAAAEK